MTETTDTKAEGEWETGNCIRSIRHVNDRSTRFPLAAGVIPHPVAGNRRVGDGGLGHVAWEAVATGYDTMG